MVKAGTISTDDERLFLVTDSIKEAIDVIKDKSIKAFGLQYKKAPKPFPGFFEKEIKPVPDSLPAAKAKSTDLNFSRKDRSKGAKN